MNYLEESVDDDTKCCGSGCYNCVLDVLQKKVKFSSTNSTKTNIFTTSENYILFEVTSIDKCNDYVYKYKFTFTNSFKLSVDKLKNYELKIPPGFHLMMRAPKLDGRETNEIFAEFEELLAKESFNFNHAKQSLIKKYDENTENNYISRPYTPVNINSDYFQFEILVRLIPNGPMSNYFLRLQIGDQTEWKGPYGHFIWTPNMYTNLVCFSQGVGIAPIYRLISSILEDESDETIIDFNGCFNNLDSILLRDEIYSFQDFWNFHCKIFLSNENEDIPKDQLKYKENIKPYRLDEREFESLFKKLADKSLTFIVICGNKRFVNFIRNCLKSFNIKEENILEY